MVSSGRLTIAQIQRTAAPESGEIKLWDSAVRGLCLRVYAGGGRSWVYRYRAGAGGRSAKLRTIRLGTWPTLSIEDARVAARAHAGTIARGGDPALVRQETRRREQATLGHLLAIQGPFERHLVERHIVKRREVLSCLRRGLKALMHADVAKLTRRDLTEALARLDHLPGARSELRKYARGLLEWCTNAGLVSANVLAGMRLPSLTRAQKLKQASRRRALSDSDIVALWKAAATTQFGALVRLALLTGMRRGELASLRWEDVKADRIVLGAHVTKTAKPHEIPLMPLMRLVLAEQARTTSPLVFPSHRTGRALSSWGIMLPPLIKSAGIGKWSLHDLRRTCRTLMSRCGIAEAAAELAVGHARAALIAIYNRDEQWNARVHAFEKVDAHIAQLIG